MKKKFFLYCLFVFLLNVTMSAQENFNKQIDDIVEKNYFISSYFDVLKTKDRDSIKKLGSIFNDLTYEEPEGWVTRKWYDESVFSFDKIYVVSPENRSDNVFRIGSITITVLDFKEYNTYFILRLQQGSYNNTEFDNCTLLNWEKFRKAESTLISYKQKWDISFPVYVNDFIFEEDVDYLLVYFDKEKKMPFATFASMNDETEVQFKNLIYNNTCDLSRVTWPRHADGSCDYDGSKKIPAVQTSNASSSTITPSQTMTVTENLKLRSGEATSTQVLTVMAAGTKVKILELGHSETIDGINSNWVKVEVQKGAKDRDGKTIKKGTVGWCYGGYLEE